MDVGAAVVVGVGAAVVDVVGAAVVVVGTAVVVVVGAADVVVVGAAVVVVVGGVVVVVVGVVVVVVEKVPHQEDVNFCHLQRDRHSLIRLSGCSVVRGIHPPSFPTTLHCTSTRSTKVGVHVHIHIHMYRDVSPIFDMGSKIYICTF